MGALCIPYFTLLENKMYQKVQHEKLYNLHWIANFTVIIFLFKIEKILSDQISTLRKRYFFLVNNEFFFFLFHLVFTWYVLFEKNQRRYRMLWRNMRVPILWPFPISCGHLTLKVVPNYAVWRPSFFRWSCKTCLSIRDWAEEDRSVDYWW